MASRNEAKIIFKAVTDQFKQGIDVAKSTISSLNAQLRLNAQEMAKGGNAAQLMEQRVNLLTQKEREQQTVVDNLQHELDATRFVYGENSEQVQKLSTQLTNAKATLQSYSNQTEQARRELAQSKTAYGQTSQAIKEQEADLKQLKQEYANVVVAQGKNSTAAKELEGKIKTLSVELGQNKEKLSLADNAADELAGSYKTAAQRSDELADKIKSVGSGMQTAGRAMTTGFTVPVIAAGSATAKAAIDIDTSLTGVRKTVDGTEEQYQELKDAAVEFSETNAVSASQILDIQALGAQLGFAIDELDEFGQVVSGLDIATNMDADQAATEMAQFANITKMSHDEISNYGSTIVGLGNNFATTEADISAMAMRLAASGTQVGMSQSDILGLATALSSMGVEAEAGGTAISTIMAQIDKDIALNKESVETWASTAGVSAQDFAAAWKNDPVSALSAVLSGMEEATAEGGNMSVMLDELGIESIRQTDVMKRLAGNSQFVADAVSTANDEWAKNTALQKEVDNRNESLAAKYEVLKNRVIAVADDVGGPLADAMLDVVNDAEPLIQAISDGAQAFADMDEESQKLVLSAVGIAAAFGPALNIFGKLSPVAVKAVSVMGKFNTQVTNMGKAAKAGKGELAGIGASIGGFASRTSVGSKAVSGFSKVLGGATRAIPILGAAFVAFEIAGFVADIARANSEAGKIEHQFNRNVQSSTAFADAYANATAQLPEANQIITASGQTVEQLNATVDEAENGITGILQQALSEQRALRQEDIDAIDGYNQQIADAYAQKSETYLTMMRTDAELTAQTMDELSAEEIAREKANIEAQGQAAIDAENESYEKRRQNLAQQLNAGLITQGEYDEKVTALSQEHRGKIDEINGQTAESYSIMGDALNRTKEDAILAFGEMTDAAATHAINMVDSAGEFTNTFKYVQDNAHITADEFRAAWESMSSESKNSASAVLESASSIADSGGQMDDSMRLAVESILVNFDNLEGEAGDAGRDAMIQLAGGMEEQLSGVADWSAMSADEIVEAIKTHLNLGDISRDEVQKYVDGIKGGQEFARDSSTELANAVKDPLAGLPGSLQSTGESASLLMASGIASGSGVVFFQAGSVAEQVVSELTGKDYSKTGVAVTQGMADGMGDGFEAKLKAAGISDKVIEAIMEALDAHSPSRRAKAAGETVPAGLAEGISQSSESDTAASELGGMVIDVLADTLLPSLGIGAKAGADFAAGIGSQSGNANTQGAFAAKSATAGLGTGDGVTPGSVIGSAFASALGSQAGNANTQGSMTAGSASAGLGTGNGTLPGSALGLGYASAVGKASGNARLQGSAVAGAAGGGLQSNNKNASSWGGHLVQNFASGISGAVRWAVNAASGIANAVKGILGHSIAEEGPLHEGGEGEIKWGRHLAQNVAIGMRDGRPEIEREAASIAEAIAVIGKSPAVIDYRPAAARSIQSRSPIGLGEMQLRVGSTIASDHNAETMAELVRAVERLDAGLGRKIADNTPPAITSRDFRRLVNKYGG